MAKSKEATSACEELCRIRATVRLRISVATVLPPLSRKMRIHAARLEGEMIKSSCPITSKPDGLEDEVPSWGFKK